MTEPNQIICGDSAEKLKLIADESIDCIATDPPYGIGFMSKDWDSFNAKPPTQSQTVGWMSPGMKVETQGDGAFEKLNEIVSPQGAYEKEKGFKKLPRQSAGGIVDFFVPIWRECLRILKPGGLAFVMAPARSDCLWRQCAALEMAGFDVSLQPILWCYNSGFPKALDIGKDFDKAAFREWVADKYTKIKCPWEHKHKEFAKLKIDCPECKRITWAFVEGYMDELTLAHVRKATSAAVNGQYGDGRTADFGWEGGPLASRTGSTEGTNLLSALVSRFWEPLSEQEKLEAWKPHSSNAYHYMLQQTNIKLLRRADDETIAQMGITEEQVAPERRLPVPDLSLPPGVRVKVGEYELPDVTDGRRGKRWECTNTTETGVFGVSGQNTITAPSTDDAKTWAGYKSCALKPAYEFVICARKPMSEKPIRENVKKWGVGGYNIDAGRMPFGEENIDFGQVTRQVTPPDIAIGGAKAGDANMNWKPEGRFPANLISGGGAMGADNRYYDLDRWAEANGFDEDWVAQAKAGLICVTKPSKKEKNAGLQEFPAQGGRPLVLAQSDWTGGSGKPMGPVEAQQNTHPTCKPVALFGWLLALGCPPGGLMLDPFVGSGSSLVAAIHGGWQYIGIDQDAHYVEIAEARTAFAKSEQMLAKDEQQRLEL